MLREINTSIALDAMATRRLATGRCSRGGWQLGGARAPAGNWAVLARPAVQQVALVLARIIVAASKHITALFPINTNTAV